MRVYGFASMAMSLIDKKKILKKNVLNKKIQEMFVLIFYF
jgi:hypothetical protein